MAKKVLKGGLVHIIRDQIGSPTQEPYHTGFLCTCIAQWCYRGGEDYTVPRVRGGIKDQSREQKKNNVFGFYHFLLSCGTTTAGLVPIHLSFQVWYSIVNCIATQLMSAWLCCQLVGHSRRVSIWGYFLKHIFPNSLTKLHFWILQGGS